MPRMGLHRYLILAGLVCDIRQVAAAVVAKFTTITNGTCADHGLFPINNATVCEAAASNLSLSDVTADATPNANRPEGCYWRNISAMGAGLWFSSNPTNAGNGASDTRWPMCSSLENTTVDNAIVRATSCNGHTQPLGLVQCLRDSCEDMNWLTNEVGWAAAMIRFARPYSPDCAKILAVAPRDLTGNPCDERMASVRMKGILLKSVMPAKWRNVTVGDICRMSCLCIPAPSPSPAPSGTEASTEASGADAARQLPLMLLASALVLVR
mmetsp:Transcript_101430/g.226503  ORF Transcript_101430/g.226503 Transcript_101430/m.226503 type:complete len:268 (+) Transcript_101430:80-883(+)